VRCHLIYNPPLIFFSSSATENKKCQDAEAKGIIVIDEDWVRHRIGGGQKGKKSAAITVAPSPPSTATSSKSSGRLDGLVFALTGKLSVSRKDMESLLLENGARVSKSITNDVTHLVRSGSSIFPQLTVTYLFSSQSRTRKYQDAEARGIEIVDEEWVKKKIRAIEDDGDNNNESEDDEEIDDYYEPPTPPTPYPMTNIFEEEFLANFWDNSTHLDGDPVTDDMFHEVEQRLGFKLPASYIELIRSQNSTSTTLRGYRAENSSTVKRINFEELSGSGPCVDSSSSSSDNDESELMVEEICEWEYPRIGLFFGNCLPSDQDMIFLDYRQSGVAGEPTVSHMDPEFDSRTVVIAPNFEIFVRNLVH
jgi:hypothetical protein